MNKSELMVALAVYSEALLKLSVKLEDVVDGSIQESSKRLQEVYTGKGAEAFFLRWTQVQNRITADVENMQLLRVKLSQLDERLEVKEIQTNE